MKYTKHQNKITAHRDGHKVTGQTYAEVNRKMFYLMGIK